MGSRHNARRLLTQADMEALTTSRLIAYKNSLLRVPEGPFRNECGDHHYGCWDWNKTNPEWVSAMAACKDILSKREHVPRVKR